MLEHKVDDKFEQKKIELSTKEDFSNVRLQLVKTICLTSHGHLIAIIAFVVSLILILKK